MVNYRNDLETEAFLHKCFKIKGADQAQFAIANNSAQSREDLGFSGLSSNSVCVVNFPDNPGYFPAAQKVWEQFKTREFKYVILSNTDLEILNSDFYDLLLNHSTEENVGVIAPSIKSELTRRECNPLYRVRPTKQKIKFLKFIYSRFTFAWIYHVLSFIKARSTPESSLPDHSYVYAPNGSFLILTKNYFESGGDFSHGVRMYGEEIVLAEKLRELDLKVKLSLKLRIFHREKGSEANFWQRMGLSKRTFEFKKEAAELLALKFD